MAFTPEMQQKLTRMEMYKQMHDFNKSLVICLDIMAECFGELVSRIDKDDERAAILKERFGYFSLLLCEKAGNVQNLSREMTEL